MRICCRFANIFESRICGYLKLEICNIPQDCNLQSICNCLIEDTSLITANELKKILRAAKQIKNLLKVANYNWSIIDAFPNVKVNFFKSTINVHDYEIWLKIVETGKKISEEDGKLIHLQKKQQENQLRKDELLKIYHLADINCSEINIS